MSKHYDDLLENIKEQNDKIQSYVYQIERAHNNGGSVGPWVNSLALAMGKKILYENELKVEEQK